MVDCLPKKAIKSILDHSMEARHYSAEEYVDAINKYPKFWNSVRRNTLRSKEFSKEIEIGIQKLKIIYADLRPIDIYFEIGILRTGGTTNRGLLLIGSEIALADQSAITDEFQTKYPHLRSYFNTNPIKDVVFLNVHEYIHTQQKETIGNTLLAQTLMEGVAEFLSEIALTKESPNPQIKFGFSNENKIREAYVKEMFSTEIDNWIMNSPDNQFGIRDLGYFVGYAICKKYYQKALDKKSTVKKMIELDYNNESDLIAFVDSTKYFDRPLGQYQKEFEKSRPNVTFISTIENNSKNVKPGIIQFSINFSEEMNPDKRRFDYGPLGENAVYKFRKLIGWSNNDTTLTLEVEVRPDTHYQVLFVGANGFKNKRGIPMKPYLFEFTTSK